MKKLKRKQLENFQKSAHESFERRALLHLRRDLNAVTAELRDEDLMAVVRQAGALAKEYGLVTEVQTICFVDATILLGVRFETKPNYEWAQEILKSKVLGPQDRANLLLATAFSVFRNEKGRKQVF